MKRHKWKKISPKSFFFVILASGMVCLSNFRPARLNAAPLPDHSNHFSHSPPTTHDSEHLFSLPLKDLMNVRIQAGTITGMSAAKAPVARTLITTEDIRRTPARNIMDLIEVYVPGATFVNHMNGPRFGFRGVLGDQNYHYLLLVNGKNMNFKTQDGALVEIFNRDMNDIKEIEIIRGPGSVTYGSGAIGGVINIITHTARTSKGSQAGIEANARYRYQTVYASQGYENDKFQCYLYGSYSRSDGENNTKWLYVDRAHGYGFGFMSDHWGNKGLGSNEPSYLSDFIDAPQVKLHLNLSFLNNWHLWCRYSSYSWQRLSEETAYADGDKFAGSRTRSAVIELEKTHSFSDRLSLETRIGFDSISFREIAGYQGINQPQEDITQYNNSFSENEINAKAMLHYELNEKFRFAVGGGIYSHEYWLPEWGEEDNTFVLNMRNPIRFAVLTDDSKFYQTYGDEVSTVMPHLKSNSYSILTEANLAFHPYFHVLLSGRADKNDYTNWYYSPRLAIISSITDKDIVRLVWQRSVRIPNFPELYTMHYNGQEPPDPETLLNYELMYEHNFGNMNLNTNFYYNILDEVSWTASGADVVGSLKLCGIEAGLTIKSKKNTTGLTYAWTHQLAYDPEIIIPADLTNPDGAPMPVDNYAENRINNFPSHTIKFFWHHMWSSTLKSHINGRFSWGQNQIDLLDMFKDAHNAYGNDASKEEMNDIYDALTDHGYGKPSFTLNTSFSWRLPCKTPAELTLYAMNLVSWNHVRYAIQFYEDLSRQYPRQASFIEEPVSLGMKLEFRF